MKWLEVRFRHGLIVSTWVALGFVASVPIVGISAAYAQSGHDAGALPVQSASPATETLPTPGLDSAAPSFQPGNPQSPTPPVSTGSVVVQTEGAAPAPGDPIPANGQSFLPAQDTIAADTAEAARQQAFGPGLEAAAESAALFLQDGGPAIWAIAGLSVITLALILWKLWRLALIGAWSTRHARKAVALWETGDEDAALAVVAGRRGLRSRVVWAALNARASLPDAAAREETARVAKRQLADAGTGQRALELISTIAPLLGLLGTVMGMIAAFQALQESGSRADPAMLAGGIWEALLTTAAGMAVAIPASAALTWFEAITDRMRSDVEDAAARIFVRQPASVQVLRHDALAAE